MPNSHDDIPCILSKNRLRDVLVGPRGEVYLATSTAMDGAGLPPMTTASSESFPDPRNPRTPRRGAGAKWPHPTTDREPLRR